MGISPELLDRELGVKVPDSIKIPHDLPNLLNTDSRSISEGQWFLPIKGENFDGHKFIASAMENGASGFFYSVSALDVIPNEVLPLGIPVEDTLTFFQNFAALWRRQLDVKIIGITGSAGKTTAKEICGHLLPSIGKTLVTKGSFNNEIGVPITLCKLTKEHAFAVIEMGARHQGDIKFLCKYVDPDVCVLLNIGTAHIGEFGSVQIIRETKQEIFTTTRRDAIAICPANDEHSLEVARKWHDNVISFGEATGDVSVKAIEVRDGTMELDIKTPTETFKERIPVFHKAYPINFAAAVAAIYSLDTQVSRIRKSFNSFKGVSGRFVVHRQNSHVIIDDCYNANPESMFIGIQSLADGFSDRNIILVLGDMLELGDVSDEEHQKLGKLCTSILSPKLLVGVGPQSELMVNSAISSGMSEGDTRHYQNVDAFLPELKDILSQGNLLYVKASNGIKLNKVVEKSLLST